VLASACQIAQVTQHTTHMSFIMAMINAMVAIKEFFPAALAGWHGQKSQDLFDRNLVVRCHFLGAVQNRIFGLLLLAVLTQVLISARPAVSKKPVFIFLA
jgi:hypothetical protein